MNDIGDRRPLLPSALSPISRSTIRVRRMGLCSTHR